MNIFRFALSRLLRRWLAPRATEGPGHFFDYRLNKEYVEKIAARYAMLGALVAMHALLLVGGILLTLAALARAVDVDNSLHTTALFWTGLGITLYSIAAMLMAFRSIRSVEIRSDLLLVQKEARPSLMPRLLVQVVQPAFEGLIIGLRSPRAPSRRVIPEPPRLQPVDTGREDRLAS